MLFFIKTTMTKINRKTEIKRPQKPVQIQQFLLHVFPHPGDLSSFICSSSALLMLQIGQERKQLLLLLLLLLKCDFEWKALMVFACIQLLSVLEESVSWKMPFAVGFWQCSPYFRFLATQAKMWCEQRFEEWTFPCFSSATSPNLISVYQELFWGFIY